MEKSSATPETSSSQEAGHEQQVKYKGVRLRKWGKYVSEIRLPNSRERIWLGSYDTAVEAARAFDAAQFCLRGPSANFNFSDNPPDIPGRRSLTPGQIQFEAAQFAHAARPQDDADPNNHQVEVQQSTDDGPQDAAPNNHQVEVQQSTDDGPSNTQNSLLDEFRTMGWESESVSEFGYFQGFDDFQNELFLSGPNYIDDEVEETNEESFTTHGSFLWNF